MNSEAVSALIAKNPTLKSSKALLEARGVEVRIARIAAHFLHLDVIMGMLAPGLAAVCLEVIPDWIPEWLTSLGVQRASVCRNL